jgi:peptide/nickel transport system permease protein
MTNFLIRRFAQILVITFLASLVAYVLFYIAPGGPLQRLAEINQGGRNRLDPGAEERIKKTFDLDLYQVPRFLRWLIGFPTGPITIGGQEILNDWVVGCLREGQSRLSYGDGSSRVIDCAKPVFLRDLQDPVRRHSKGVLRLDFGLSQQILRDRPVLELIQSRLGPTLMLVGLANFLALLIAVPLGIIAAVKQYSRLDYLITTATFFFSGMPTLLIGLLSILFFGVVLKDAGFIYFPVQAAFSDFDQTVPILGEIKAESFGDRLWHLALPAGILTLVSLTGWSRFIRSSMLEVLKQDYVRTARAKGLIERVVIMKHALRNGLIPFITLVAGLLPDLFAGAFVTETIFSWPGLGRLFVQSVGGSDYPVAMAILLIITFLTLVGYLISDILYTIVDPRIRLQ